MIENIYITGDDLKKIYRKKRRKIWQMAVLGALLALGYFLFTPPSYQATATFKQSSSRSEPVMDLKKLVQTFSGSGSEVATIPLMLSRAVLTKTIEELGLQAIVDDRGRLVKKLLSCRDNLLVEIGKQPAEEDGFQFQHVRFNGEKPASFFIRFSSPDSFDLLDKNQEKLTAGLVKEPVHAQDTQFIVNQTPSKVKLGKLYPLSFLPLRSVIEDVKSRTRIKSLREDKNILIITFSDINPKRSALFVNTLMSKYQEFLTEENKSVIGSQIKYLDQRQNELNSKLDVDIQHHVAILKQSLLKQGYLGIQEEMESILQPLQTYKSRLSEIEIEMAGLIQRISPADSVLAAPHSKLVMQFGQSIAEQIRAASSLLQRLEKDQPLTQTLASSTFTTMIEEVEHSRTQQKPDYQEKKHQLATHLNNFLDHLFLRQKNLQESTTYIDQLETDFNGMTLEAARGLFQQYCRQLDDLHAQLKQVIFFRDHLNEPHFEISTLSNILNDSVTQQLVQKSSELSGQLCDVINRSSREHERLKETLAVQKRFLESHLSQTLDLGKIRIQLIKEKIKSLYGVMKDLLQKEKEVLENKIEELKLAMQELPELWHLDKSLKFKAQLTKGMMEGLTHITESKNLSRHLYQVESKPLDSALPPLAPHPPHLLIKSIGAAISFAVLFYVFVLIQALLKGMPISQTTLRLMGGHTSGTFSQNAHVPFSQLADHDLETLRKMAAFLLERKKVGTVVGLLSQKGSGFCFNLAGLLSLHHQKVLIIDCNFDRIASPQDQPGLWQYLNHTTTDLPIRHEKTYDLLTSGGTTRHSVELLSSPVFSQILVECKTRYDFVFLLRQTTLTSQDAEQLLQLSSLAIITANEESQNVLKPYLLWSRQKENFCATFAEHPTLTE